MESKKSDISLLGQLFVVLLVIANVLSSKTIQISLFLVPGGIICYGFTFLMIDVIGERYGQQESKKVVEFGFVIQIRTIGLIQSCQTFFLAIFTLFALFKSILAAFLAFVGFFLLLQTHSQV